MISTVSIDTRRTPSSRLWRIARILLPSLLFPLTLAAGLGLLASCTFDLDYDKYAIVYGISDYPDPVNDLVVADDDALAMSVLLDAQGFEVIPYTRTDSEATKGQLVTDRNSIASVATIDDLFVFYFSGHGGQDLPGTGGGTENTPNRSTSYSTTMDSPTTNWPSCCVPSPAPGRS
jgi:hypothetical protein